VFIGGVVDEELPKATAALEQSNSRQRSCAGLLLCLEVANNQAHTKSATTSDSIACSSLVGAVNT
jgi:hypothetical protein